MNGTSNGPNVVPLRRGIPVLQVRQALSLTNEALVIRAEATELPPGAAEEEAALADAMDCAAAQDAAGTREALLAVVAWRRWRRLQRRGGEG